MTPALAWGRASSRVLRAVVARNPARQRSVGLRCMASYTSVGYEVHGIVQGVFFRAHTVDKARSLGLVGYVMNTAQGTVKGEVQGRPEAVKEMQAWLATTGSPHSVIERADFSDERQLEALEYAAFSTRRR